MAASSISDPLNEAEKRAVREYLDAADGDWQSALVLSAHPQLYNNIGFNCQQAVEKYTRARLLSLGLHPGTSHDLLPILNRLHSREPVSDEERRSAI